MFHLIRDSSILDLYYLDVFYIKNKFYNFTGNAFL